MLAQKSCKLQEEWPQSYNLAAQQDKFLHARILQESCKISTGILHDYCTACTWIVAMETSCSTHVLTLHNNKIVIIHTTIMLLNSTNVHLWYLVFDFCIAKRFILCTLCKIVSCVFHMEDRTVHHNYLQRYRNLHFQRNLCCLEYFQDFYQHIQMMSDRNYHVQLLSSHSTPWSMKKGTVF